MFELTTTDKRTFRPQVLAWRTTTPGPWAAPRLRATGQDVYALARPRRIARPAGMSSERLYWAARSPRLLRGWAGRPDRVRAAP